MLEMDAGAMKSSLIKNGFNHRICMQVSSAQGYSSCLQQNQTVPEQNCLAVMMKQAQDVGLWSKAGHQQSDKSSGLSLEPRHIAQTDVSPNNNVSGKMGEKWRLSACCALIDN